MNKAELIEKMSEKAGMTKADAKRALDAFVEATQDCLKKGDSLSLIGFGTFSTYKRAARKGHNPSNPKKVIQIPAKNVDTKELTDDIQRRLPHKFGQPMRTDQHEVKH